MDATALLTTFVPVVSVSVGAGATYLWQVLGNRRADTAVRAQTNARLLELTGIICNIYQERWLPTEMTPTIQRLVTSLDDMQIALAYRRDIEFLWKLGQVRVDCEHMIPQSADEMVKFAGSDDVALERQQQTLKVYAGNALDLILTMIKEKAVLAVAQKYAAQYGFSQAAHHARLLATFGDTPNQ